LLQQLLDGIVRHELGGMEFLVQRNILGRMLPPREGARDEAHRNMREKGKPHDALSVD